MKRIALTLTGAEGLDASVIAQQVTQRTPEVRYNGKAVGRVVQATARTRDLDVVIEVTEEAASMPNPGLTFAIHGSVDEPTVLWARLATREFTGENRA